MTSNITSIANIKTKIKNELISNFQEYISKICLETENIDFIFIARTDLELKIYCTDRSEHDILKNIGMLEAAKLKLLDVSNE